MTISNISIKVLPKIDESFKDCGDCIHCNDTEEICQLRNCVHAFCTLKECYKPKDEKESE